MTVAPCLSTPEHTHTQTALFSLAVYASAGDFGVRLSMVTHLHVVQCFCMFMKIIYLIFQIMDLLVLIILTHNWGTLTLVLQRRGQQPCCVYLLLCWYRLTHHLWVESLAISSSQEPLGSLGWEKVYFVVSTSPWDQTFRCKSSALDISLLWHVVGVVALTSL